MHHARILRAAVVLLAAVIAPSATGATKIYYVRKTGNNDANGLTPATAYRTIAKAISVTTTPDTIIYIGPGTYEEMIEINASRNGSAALPNKLIADTTGAMTGDAAGAVTILGDTTRTKGLNLATTSYWQITGFSFSGQSQYAYYANASNYITVQNCTFTSSMYNAIYHYGGAAAVIANNNFIQTPTTSTNIGVYYTTGTSRITGNRFVRTGSDYLSTPFHNGVIQNSTVNRPTTASGTYGSISYGIMAYGDMTTGGDFVIENNVGTDQYIGIMTYQKVATAKTTIANNTMVGCYFGVSVTSYGTSTYSNGVSTMTPGGQVKIYDNILSDCYQAVTGTVGSASSVTVSGLLVYNTILSPAVTASVTTSGSILTGNPNFAAASSGDFTPGSGSAALDATSGVWTASADITGAARPFDGDHNGVAKNDLGAYERMSSRTRVLSWRERIPVEKRTGVDVP